MTQLYYNKKQQKYYYVIDEELYISCCKCNKIIELNDIVIIHRSFTHKSYMKSHYCEICIKKHKKRIYDEFIVARITLETPSYSIIVPELRPALRNRNGCSVFSLAESDNSLIVVDNTVLAGRIGYDDLEIGDNAVYDRIKELDKKIDNERELKKYLGNLGRAKIAIEENEVRRLK